MKILLIAGHGAGDPGAVGNSYKEADLARELVSMLKRALKSYAEVDVFDFSKSAYRYIKSNSFNFKVYDYVLEVHFNGADNSAANGTEILVHPSEKGTSVENAILSNIVKLGFKNRGVKRRTDLQNMNICKGSQGVSYALLETCFVSNANDMKLFQSKKAEISEAVADGIIAGFGLSSAKNDNIAILKDKLHLADETIEYLQAYKYADELIERITNAVK